MVSAVRAIVAALLLTGCATGVRALTPYTSDEIEQARAACLGSGAVWMESAERARCVMPPSREPDEREERT